MRYARDYCDKLRACEFKHFDTTEEYQACVTAANADIVTCEAGCSGRGDPAAATAAHDAARAACDDARTIADNACIAAFIACSTACPAGPNFATCVAACGKTQEGCTLPVNQVWVMCGAQADADYTAALAALALDIDQDCLAGCCSDNSQNPTVCEAGCITAYTAAIVPAESERAECEVACWSFDVDKGAIFDEQCGHQCAVTYDGKLATAGKDYLDCVYPCLGDERCPIPAQYPTFVFFPDQELPVVTLSTSGANGAAQCTLAYAKTYTDSYLDCLTKFVAGGTDEEFAACTNDALVVMNRAALECCWVIRGRSKYEDDIDLCGAAFSKCKAAANVSCPPPGIAPGDPCFDPFSADCATATSEWHQCVDPLLDNCNNTLDGCVKSIKDTPRCNSCPVGNEPPPDA